MSLFNVKIPDYPSNLVESPSDLSALSQRVFQIYNEKVRNDQDRSLYYRNKEYTPKLLINRLKQDGVHNFVFPMVEVPNLIGMSLEEAGDLLGELDLKLEVIKQELFSESVVKQEPKPKTAIPPKTRVTLWLGLRKSSELRKLASELEQILKQKTASKLLGGKFHLLT